LNGADATSIGSGEQNTTDILVGCVTDGIAAKICNDAIINGYDDWFLGTYFEMYELFNLSASNWFSSMAFVASSYWTSSEIDLNAAISINYTTPSTQGNSQKNSNTRSIRPIRAF